MVWSLRAAGLRTALDAAPANFSIAANFIHPRRHDRLRL
jgi:hypothetical protein